MPDFMVFPPSPCVVGYQQVEIPAQAYTMIGVMYADMTNGAISVQDIFPDPLGQGLTGAAGSANADQLMYWDPDEIGSYVTLYLNSNTGTTSVMLNRKNKWCTTRIQTDTTWGTANNIPSTKKLVSGMGLWLKRVNYASPITLTMSGSAVVADGGRNITIKEGYNMISGGFSSPFVPNPDTAGTGDAIDWLGKGCRGAAGSANADQLMFWDPGEIGSYVTLYLNSNTGTTSVMLNRKNHWCTTRVQTDTTWGTANNVPSPKVIPAGRGVWYKRLAGAGAFTLNLDQPYSL